MNQPIRVLIADDNAVFRQGLCRLLASDPEIEVVGEAGDGYAAVEQALACAPDVVLMDIRMPVLDGIEATRQLSARGVRAPVLILTTYGLEEYVYEALRAGAAGFLVKTDPPERLLDGVKIVAAGDALLTPEVTRPLIDRFVTGARPYAPAVSPQLAQLTEREREVMQHVAAGLSNAEIARALYISEGTVKTHVAHLLDKLALRDRVQIVIFAYENGLAGGPSFLRREGGTPRA